MPTTSHDRPLRLIVWPTTSRPPRTDCQVSCDSIATSGPPVRVSAAVKCRPRAAGTPSVFSSAASTLPVRTRRGRSLADRFSSPVVNAPTLRERLVPLRELEVLRRRDPELIEPQRRKAAGDEHQPVRLRVSQRPEDHAVDDGEDRRVGPDAERQRQDGDEGESRRPQEVPDGVTEVLDQGGHDVEIIRARPAPGSRGFVATPIPRSVTRFLFRNIPASGSSPLWLAPAFIY